MATYSATGLAIFDSSLDPPLDNRPNLSSAQPASVYGEPPLSCLKCTPPDSAAPSIRSATSTIHKSPPLDTGDSLGDRLAYPTPRTTQGELSFFTPGEVYRTPHDVLSSCATTSLYLSPMVNLKTPTSTCDGMFTTPETTPAISYYESTKSTPNLYQPPHGADHPSTVGGSSFSPSIYRTPFELVSSGAIDYRPPTVMNQNAPAPSFDRYTSPEAPLEQEFHTPDGSPPSPYHTPHNGSLELLLEFQPPAGYRASPTSRHPLSFLSFSSTPSPGTPQGTPTVHDPSTPGSIHPSTTPNKEERSPIIEVFQAARRLRNQRTRTSLLRRSHSSVSLTNPSPPPDRSSLRAREMMELAQELQKVRAITEDFVCSSPKQRSPPEDRGLVRSNTFGSHPGKCGRHDLTCDSTSRGSFFDPGHARFPSSSTTSTAFFDFEENDDAGNLDEMKPSRKSLSIITAWPTRAAIPPPLLSPFKEQSDEAVPGDDPLITPNINMGESAIRCTPLAGSPVLPAGGDQAPLECTQSQSDASSTVRRSPRSPSSPFKEGMRVQDAPAIVMGHLDLGHNTPTEKLGFLAEEHRASASINDARVLKRSTTNRGFAESTSSALGLSPSIYLSPMHEAQFSNNSLGLASITKPEIERGLSTPSFISGVLQAGLLLEKLEREDTASFEEDMEAVHFQVLTAVVGTAKQASSSSSLSHYSTEDSPKRSQLQLPSFATAGSIYTTATDSSAAAQPSPPNASTSLAPSNLQPPSDYLPHLTQSAASAFAVDPLPGPSSVTVNDSANSVQGLTQASEVDRGGQLLKPPSVVDAIEPISTGVEGAPPNGSLSASDSRPQSILSTDPSSFDGKSSAEMEAGPKQGTQAATPPRVRRASNRSTGQSSGNHSSSPQRISTLHPSSASGSTSVSPVSPSSVISRASARLTSPFSFLHPSPLPLPSPHASGASPVGPRRLAKAPEQPKSHKRSGTVTPGDMKRPPSARQQLSRLLGGVEFGVGKASSLTVPEDKADVGLVRPDVFGAGEGGESWIRNSRESATNHEVSASSNTKADREVATAIQEEKGKKRRTSVRPMSMIWLGSNKEKSLGVTRKSTKVPLTLQSSIEPPPSNNLSSWSMLNARTSAAVGNDEGLRIINLPPPPAVGATIDVPMSRKPHKSRSHQRSVAVPSGGEESDTEVGPMKGRSRSSFLGALFKK